MTLRVQALIAALALVFTACSSAQPVEDAGLQHEPADDEPGAYLDMDMEVPPGGEAATVSVPGISHHDCVGRLEPGERVETIELDDWTVSVDGYRLSFRSRSGDTEPLVLGVIADIKEDTGENIFNLGRFIAWWRSEGVDAVVLAGDGGETEEGLSRVLGTLAEPGWPVFVINGNREAREVYLSGVQSARERHPNVFNIGQQRVVDLPGATLVALPGYHDPRFLHSQTACRYHQWDVASLVPEAARADSPVVLVAHSGPRGATPRAIDYAKEAGNVGDANINRLILSGRIPFGVFGHIQEAGGRATDLLGESLVTEGEYADSFFLNVGPADSLPWAMNDRSQSRGMAGLIRFEGERAAYWIKRLPALTAEERVRAAE